MSDFILQNVPSAGAATISLTALGNTTSSSAGTFGSLLNVSGAGIISAGVGNGTITISATTPSVTNFSTITGTIAGNNLGGASTTFTVGNSLSLSGAGLVSVGGSGGTVTISATNSAIQLTATGNTTAFSFGSFLNSLKFSGAGIVSVGFPLGSGTVLISATTPSVTNYSTITATMTGNTLGAASTTLSIGNSLSVSGAGAVSVGASAGTITISAPVAVNYSTITATMTGNTLGAASTTLTIGNSLSISGAGGISVGASAGTITISGAGAGANVVTSLNGSNGSISISAGAGIGIGQANSTITISASQQTSTITIVGNTIGTDNTSSTFAGALIVSGLGGISAGITGGTLQFSASTVPVLPSISYITNIALPDLGPTLTGSTTATAAIPAFSNSVFLDRIYIPAKMNLTEVDMAVGVAFPATNQGQGTINRSFGIYSFVNSTSLASVITASGSSSFTTGTSTVLGSTSLSQFQGGWSGNLIQPLTFASSSISPGEYVVANFINLSQQTGSWSVTLFGRLANTATSTATVAAATSVTIATLSGASTFASATQALTAYTGTTSVSAFSNLGTAEGWIVTGSTGNTAMTAWSISGTVSTAASSQTLSGASLHVSLQNSDASASFLLSASSTQFAITNLALTAGVLSSGGTAAMTHVSSLTTASIAAVTSAGVNALGSTTISLLASTIPVFGFVGTGTNSSQFQDAFVGGVVSSNGLPGNISLTATSVLGTGSNAALNIWYALIGS